MFSANKIHLAIGNRPLLDGVSFTLHPEDRVGLSGMNGAGKSTLLRIMAGLTEPDSGVFIKQAEASLGYLPQEIVAPDLEKTVWEEAASALTHIRELATELEELHESLKSAPGHDLERLLQREAEISSKLEHSGAYEMDSRIASVLSELGFSEDSFHKPLSTFSGGWIMRVRLAAILLLSPDLLLLDEPTNHLDLSSVMWLENWLSAYKGTVVLVSHDQTFMDSVVNRIFELEAGKLSAWNGNFSSWLEQKEKIRIQEEARIKNINLRLAELERFIQRFRSKATKARQVQNRLKEYERLKADLPQGVRTSKGINFSFPDPERSGSVVARGYGVSKKFNSSLFKGVDFIISRGDRIAVVGDNGAGKSTLARIIAGEEKDFDGKIEYGHNVRCSWFAQHQAASLDPDRTVLETVLQGDGESKRARDICGAFLFRGDDVDKKVGSLSGGEKSRVALASILFSPGNFLILDEPTNHLDIISRKMLKQAISSYKGTLLIVSHDRFFLDSLVNRVWHLDHGEFEQYPGDLKEFIDSKKEKSGLDKHKTVLPLEQKTEERAGRLSNREKRRKAAAERAEFKKMAGPVMDEITACEKEIEALEEKKAELEILLADPGIYQDEERAREVNMEYGETGRRLETLYDSWEDASSRLEEIKTGFNQLS